MNGCKGAGTIVLHVVQRFVPCSIFQLVLILFSGRFKRPTTYASCLIASQFILSNTHSQLITPMILTPYLLFNLYVLPCFVLVVAIDPLALVSPP